MNNTATPAQPTVQQNVARVTAAIATANALIVNGTGLSISGIAIPADTQEALHGHLEKNSFRYDATHTDGRHVYLIDGVQGQKTWKKLDGISVQFCQEPTNTPPVIDAPTTAVALRDYQQQAVDAVMSEQARGTKSVLLQAPTGAGKTVMFCAAINSYLSQAEHKRALVIAHSEELLMQAREKLIQSGVKAELIGILGAGYRPTPADKIIISTVQSSHKARHFLSPADDCMVVIDEAHRSLGESYQRAIRDVRPEFLLGATATAVRTDGRGLGETYQKMISAISIKEAIQRGIIIKPRVVIPSVADYELLQAIKKAGADSSLAKAEGVMSTPRIIGDVEDEIIRHASDQQVLVFCPTVKNANAVKQQLSRQFTCEVIDGKTPTAERHEITTRFKNGELQVLCSVSCITEGFDVPDASVGINLRPTKSPVLWLQMIGRIVRSAPGKTSATWIDMTGSWYELGDIDDERYSNWSLDGDGVAKKGDGKGKKESRLGQSPVTRTCECGEQFEGTPMTPCPRCGAVIPGRNWESENIESLKRDLVAAEERMTPRERIQKRVAALETFDEKRRFFHELCHYAKHSSKTRNIGQAVHWYKEIVEKEVDPVKTFRWGEEIPTKATIEIVEKHIQLKRKQWRAIQKSYANQAVSA